MAQYRSLVVSTTPATSNDRQPTLRLRRPVGSTAGLALLLLALFLAAGEALARTPAAQARLATQDWGTNHRQFEFQMDRLTKAAATFGPPECLVLGNSMVWRGLDPAMLATSFGRQTGRSLRCFNFGVDGLPAAAAGTLAQILVEEFRPRLLIYGTDARDYAVPRSDEATRAILDSSWIRYRRGEFSVTGWLVEHSALYRALEPLGNLLRFDFRRGIHNWRGQAQALSNGYDPDPTVGDYVQERPVPGSSRHVDYYFSLLGDYHLRPENLDGLQQILAQEKRGVEVIVVEMPVPPTYLDFFGRGESDYQRFLGQISALAAAEGASFLASTRRWT
ncbi:MAG: hypothetical protein ACRDHL_03680, partial [Candidatus Promineifilaceae bacterium]